MKKSPLLIISAVFIFFISGAVLIFFEQQRGTPVAATNTKSSGGLPNTKQLPSYHPTRVPTTPLHPLGGVSITRDVMVQVLGGNGFVFLKDTMVDQSDPLYKGQEAYVVHRSASGATVTLIGPATGLLAIKMSIPLNGVSTYDTSFSDISMLANAIDSESVHWLSSTYQDFTQRLQSHQITVPIAQSLSLDTLQYTLEITNLPNSVVTFIIQPRE